MVRADTGRTDKPPRFSRGKVCRGIALQRLEGAADLIAQAFEPGARPRLSRLECRRVGKRGSHRIAIGSWGQAAYLAFLQQLSQAGSQALVPESAGSRPRVCLSASPTAMAQAIATLSDRTPGRKGITTLASAHACTAGGTPAVSRPNSNMSAGAK